MSGNCVEERSGNAGVHTNPAKYQPETSTSIHGRNTVGYHGGYSSSNSEQSTVGQNIPRGSDNSSDFDVWVVPNCSDVKPDQGAIPKVKPAEGVFQKAWKDFYISIKRKQDMEILEQCGCKESLLPVKMQYLLNFHIKKLETALYDELLKLKCNVKYVIPGDQCLSIEVNNYTDDKVLENVILLLIDKVNEVNYCQSIQASKHPELLLKEYIDSGNLTIYVDDEKVFVVGMVDNPKKVTEMLRKKLTSTCTDYSRDIQVNKPIYCQLLEYHQFLPSLKQKHPSVNIAMDEVRSIVSFCGDNRDDVQAAVNDVHVFTKDFAVEDITLDPLLIQLLKLPDIKTFIMELCEEQDLKVIWTLTESNHSITCHCKNKKAVKDFNDVLQHNLERKTYSKRSFGDKTISFSTTNMFSDFVKTYDGKCLVSTVDGNIIYIFTTRDIGNELALLEVTFKNKCTKIDIQKNLTQEEKKDIHGQTSATRKEDTTVERMEFETSFVKVSMPHQELQILKKFDFKTHLARQIPDMQVKITDDGIILVSGTERRLNDEIKSFMSKFGFKRIESLPPSVLEFYDNCDIVKRTVDARLEEKRIVCYWYVDRNENSLSVFTPDRNSLSTAESEIFNTVKYTEYSNTDYAKEVLKCSEVKLVLEKKKNELTLADIDREEFLVVGLHDAVEEFSKNFERTSERRTPTLPVIKQRFGVSKDFVNCYNKLKSDVWNTFCDLHKVKVEIDQNDEVVVVGSEKQKVQDAVSLLQKEIGKLIKQKWSCEVFDPRDIQAKLQSDTIPSLENRFQCSVSIESNTNLVYQQQLGQWVNWDKGLHLILVHGHMSEMAADVLVCPINKSLNPSGLGSSMMEKGGSIMKQDLHQKAIIGGQDIYLSSETGNLPCLMMAYLAVPEYKHGVDMKSHVFKCIQELFCSVEKAQLQSLVIPVKLWNDIPETTFLQWFVSALNKNLGQLNALKQIYLCIEDMHKSDVKLKVLSDELLTTWHEYNFEYLIENLQTSLPGKRTVSQKAWKDFYVSIKRKEDMKILEQCGCKESLLPVKMQYLLNFHLKELETALYNELLKLKCNVICVKPDDQCLSIEVKNYTEDKVLENVILLLCDEVNKVNYCHSIQASKHPELLLKEFIDRGDLAIYLDDENVFVVGMVDNPKKVNEMLRKNLTSTDYSSTAALKKYKTDVQLDNPVKCELLTYLQFLPSVKQKHPSVNVAMDEERSIISICGNNLVDVHAAVEDVDIFIEKFAVEDIELDPLLIQLLKLQDIKTLIRKLCEEQDLKVIWTLSELNNRITCHCKDRKAVQDFSDVLKHNLEKKTYQYSQRSLGDKTMIFSTTNMFSDFVKKYDGKCLVSTVEGNSIDIFTTRDIGNELALLEVTFKGTKADIQKNLTQDEKKEIHDQKSEVTITDDGIEWIDGTKRRLNVEVNLFMSKIGFKRTESLPTSVLKFYDTCDILLDLRKK